MSKAIRLLEILVRFNGFKEETGEHTEKVNPKHIIVVLINQIGASAHKIWKPNIPLIPVDDFLQHLFR